jgi:hypothetical protein
MHLCQALVVNMTPTEVRVVEAIVGDSRKAEIRIVLRDSWKHDVGAPEHLEGQNTTDYTSCHGCRKVLSWLNFSRSHSPTADVRVPTTRTEARVVSGGSNASSSGGSSTKASDTDAHITVPEPR